MAQQKSIQCVRVRRKERRRTPGHSVMRDEGVGWCCPSGSCHVLHCCFWLRLCGNVRAPPTFQQALSQFLTPAGTWDDPACASVWESGVLLETSSHLWTGVIYLALIFSLYSPCSQCWGSKIRSRISQQYFGTRVYRYELYFLQTKSNLGRNLALQRGNSSVWQISLKSAKCTGEHNNSLSVHHFWCFLDPACSGNYISDIGTHSSSRMQRNRCTSSCLCKYTYL